MKITKRWLQSKEACLDGIAWFSSQEETDGIKVVEKLIADDKLDWANWLIVRTMDYKQCVSYAVFAAEQVIDIYEKRYPGDDRPRRAIEAAKVCIQDPSEENKKIANAAMAAAWAAARAAAEAAAWAAAEAAARAAAEAAAWAAAEAARAAAEAAAWAARAAAEAAAWAARAAAEAAAWAAAEAAMRAKILKYGLKMLKEQK